MTDLQHKKFDSIKLKLFVQYSRKTLGFERTRSSGIKVNGNEKVLFVNLGDKYDNKFTKDGLIHEPRLKRHLLIMPQTFSYYLFLCFGNSGDYYYVGVSKNQKRHKNNYNLFEVNTSEIPENIVKSLGGFQQLP